MSNTGPQDLPDEALVDLLIKQITEGLSPAEQRTLDPLDSAVTGTLMRELERAAAAITLADTAPHTEMLPPALRARIEQQAQTVFADDKVAKLKAARATPPPEQLPAWVAPASRRIGVAGWFAAAACFLLAVFGWLRPLQSHLAPPAARQRAALLARPESIKVNLAATKDPAAAGVTGDAVWDPVTQRGYLHFVGLPANDPHVRQYQLWIVDGGRDRRYPVDGGVFDVPANSSEVIVPIRAALPVRSAKAFAVTIEKPGGVVVSEQQHVVVLGAAS
jgi:Anti-sigma-K factor rskA